MITDCNVVYRALFLFRASRVLLLSPVSLLEFESPLARPVFDLSQSYHVYCLSPVDVSNKSFYAMRSCSTPSCRIPFPFVSCPAFPSPASSSFFVLATVPAPPAYSPQWFVLLPQLYAIFSCPLSRWVPVLIEHHSACSLRLTSFIPFVRTANHIRTILLPVFTQPELFTTGLYVFPSEVPCR